MSYKLKMGPEVRIGDVLVVFGPEHKYWLTWLIDEIEWNTPKYGHQN